MYIQYLFDKNKMNVQKNIPQTLSQSQTQPKNLIPNQPKKVHKPR